MKRFFALAFAAGLALSAGAAQASITIDVSPATTNFATAKGHETAFLNSLGGMATFTEDFETIDPADYVGAPVGNTISTAVGTFRQVNRGQINGGLRILDKDTTPFGGRRDMTNSDNSGNWLDSNDSTEVEWKIDFNSMITKLGFFLTDVNDVRASMTATFMDGTNSVVENFLGAGGSAKNGEMIYVTAMFHDPVTSITFKTGLKSNDSPVTNDGWGIDNITTAAVPLPAGVLLLGLGLGGLVAYRRRQAA